MTYKEFADRFDLDVNIPQSEMNRKMTDREYLYQIDVLAKLIRHLTDKLKWHTGTPTEEGWYLVSTNQADEYAVGYFDKTIQSFTRICFFDSDEVVAWMPIPPFEASKVEPQHVKKLPKEWYDPSEDGLYEPDKAKNENIFDENGKVKAEYAEALNKNMLYNVCRYQAEANPSEEKI